MLIVFAKAENAIRIDLKRLGFITDFTTEPLLHHKFTTNMTTEMHWFGYGEMMNVAIIP